MSQGWLIRARDAAIVLAIFIAGAVIGTRYMSSYQEPAPEDQDMAPAVLSACGRGFIQPSAAGPALRAFLHRESPEFSCSQLPASISPIPLDVTQRLYRYLMMAVAIEWRWSGISWRGLAPLFGVLFGVTLCAAYGLFRLAGGPVVGVLGVIPLAVSAHHLGALPQLRDYAKAPFILLLILAGAHLAIPPLRPRRNLLLAALFGVTMGIGFGFRNDLLINVLPFLVVVLLLMPGRWRENLKLKAACVLLATGTFAVTAWPILSAYGSGSNTGHVAVLGLTSRFDEPLGVTRPIYDLGPHYLDTYAATVIGTHEQTEHGQSVEYLSPAYERAAFHVIGDVFRSMPADIFIRGMSSVLEVLDFPLMVGQRSRAVPPGLTTEWTKAFYERQSTVLRWFAGMGVPAAVVAVLIIGARDVRAGIALFALLLYYCGYPAVQFDIRHFFHLEFVAWCALAFVAATACRAIWRPIAARQWPRPTLAMARNGAVTALVSVLLIMIPGVSLRAYQQRHLTSLLENYVALPRTPLQFKRTTGAGPAVMTFNALWNDRNAVEPLSVRYLVAEFRADDCGAVDLPLFVKYDAKSSDSDFSYTTRIPLMRDGPTFALVPAYYAGYSHFTSLVLPHGYDRCLTSVSRIDSLRNVPLMLNLTLTPRWRATSLFERLAKWESDASTPQSLILPDDLVETKDVSVRRGSLKADEVAQGVAVNSSEHRWFTAGPLHAGESHQLLLHFPAEPLEAGTALLVRGTVKRGGLRIGTTEGDHLVDSRAVTSPGPFTVLIGIPSAGAYGIRITDESAAEWRREHKSMLRAMTALIAPWVLSDDFELNDIVWVAAPR